MEGIMEALELQTIKLLPIKFIDNGGRKKHLLPIEFIDISHNGVCFWQSYGRQTLSVLYKSLYKGSTGLKYI